MVLRRISRVSGSSLGGYLAITDRITRVAIFVASPFRIQQPLLWICCYGLPQGTP